MHRRAKSANWATIFSKTLPLMCLRGRHWTFEGAVKNLFALKGACSMSAASSTSGFRLIWLCKGRGLAVHRYGVPASDADAFEELVIGGPYAKAIASMKAAGSSAAQCRLAALNALLSKTTMLSPKLLMDAGAPSEP